MPPELINSGVSIAVLVTIIVFVTRMAKNMRDEHKAYTDEKLSIHSTSKEEAKREHDLAIEHRMDIQYEQINRKLDEAKHDLICQNQRLNLEGTMERELRPVKDCIINIDNSLKKLHERQVEITEWMRTKINGNPKKKLVGD
jgi:hypothetical protein